MSRGPGSARPYRYAPASTTWVEFNGLPVESKRTHRHGTIDYQFLVRPVSGELFYIISATSKQMASGSIQSTIPPWITSTPGVRTYWAVTALLAGPRNGLSAGPPRSGGRPWACSRQRCSSPDGQNQRMLPGHQFSIWRVKKAWSAEPGADRRTPSTRLLTRELGPRPAGPGPLHCIQDTALRQPRRLPGAGWLLRHTVGSMSRCPPGSCQSHDPLLNRIRGTPRRYHAASGHCTVARPAASTAGGRDTTDALFKQLVTAMATLYRSLAVRMVGADQSGDSKKLRGRVLALLDYGSAADSSMSTYRLRQPAGGCRAEICSSPGDSRCR